MRHNDLESPAIFNKSHNIAFRILLTIQVFTLDISYNIVCTILFTIQSFISLSVLFMHHNDLKSLAIFNKSYNIAYRILLTIQVFTVDISYNIVYTSLFTIHISYNIAYKILFTIQLFTVERLTT
jgi:hypothetical protein